MKFGDQKTNQRTITDSSPDLRKSSTEQNAAVPWTFPRFHPFLKRDDVFQQVWLQSDSRIKHFPFFSPFLKGFPWNNITVYHCAPLRSEGFFCSVIHKVINFSFSIRPLMSVTQKMRNADCHSGLGSLQQPKQETALPGQMFHQPGRRQMLPFYFCLPQMRLVIKSRKKTRTGTMQKKMKRHGVFWGKPFPMKVVLL